MNFVSQEKYEESRNRRFKELEKRKRKRGEELVRIMSIKAMKVVDCDKYDFCI